MPMAPNTLGIDPGLSGAMALLGPDGRLLDLIDMPTLKLTKTRKEIDLSAVDGLLCDWLVDHGQMRCMIETPGMRPGQSAQSGLKAGIGWGGIVGILTAQRIGYERVTPQKWQKALMGKLDKGAAKDRSKAFAQQLFPGADLGKRKTQDRADALCIAVYGHRVFGGGDGE